MKYSKADLLRMHIGDIDPAKHAGEGWFATEEYFPQDISHNPYVLGDTLNQDAYYPGPIILKKR